MLEQWVTLKSSPNMKTRSSELAHRITIDAERGTIKTLLLFLRSIFSSIHLTGGKYGCAFNRMKSKTSFLCTIFHSFASSLHLATSFHLRRSPLHLLHYTLASDLQSHIATRPFRIQPTLYSTQPHSFPNMTYFNHLSSAHGYSWRSRSREIC